MFSYTAHVQAQLIEGVASGKVVGYDMKCHRIQSVCKTLTEIEQMLHSCTISCSHTVFHNIRISSALFKHISVHVSLSVAPLWLANGHRGTLWSRFSNH